jgi:hypothetical protein
MENKEYYKKLFALLTEYELIPNSEGNKYYLYKINKIKD